MAFSRDTAIGTGLGAIVVAAIIAGLFVTGGPAEARRQKEDQLREAALLSTANALVCLERAGVAFPEDRAQQEAVWKEYGSTGQEKCFNSDLRADPVTEAPFALMRENGRVTQICANFATKRKQDNGPLTYASLTALPALGERRDTAGEHCFDIDYSAGIG